MKRNTECERETAFIMHGVDRKISSAGPLAIGRTERENTVVLPSQRRILQLRTVNSERKLQVAVKYTFCLCFHLWEFS
jgi:hypothetical protein